MTFGAYIFRRSPLHSLGAQIKLLGLAIVSVLVFQIANLIGLAVMLLVSVAGVFVAKLPLLTVWQQLRSIVPLLVAILLIQGALESWQIGLMAALRFTILVLLATLVTMTTRVSDLIEAIEQALRPLQRLGLHPGQIGFMLALSMHLVPVLLHQFEQIREAQRARGLDRHWLALLVPLLVKALRLADELSEALDARCFGDTWTND